MYVFCSFCRNCVLLQINFSKFYFTDCDYVRGPYVVTFYPFTTTATFNVTIIDDDIFEGNEKFSLVIDNPTDAKVSRDEPYSPEVTILDDEIS